MELSQRHDQAVMFSDAGDYIRAAPVLAGLVAEEPESHTEAHLRLAEAMGITARGATSSSVDQAQTHA